MGSKLVALRERMKDVRTNVAWRKKIEARKPQPTPVPIKRFDMGILQFKIYSNLNFTYSRIIIYVKHFK